MLTASLRLRIALDKEQPEIYYTTCGMYSL